MKLNENKPWLNERGEPLYLTELREISKSWDEKTWNAYLESQEHGRQEHLADDFNDLLRVHDREEAMRRYFEEEFGGPPEELPETFDPNAVARALSELTHLEKEVFILTFWNGKTEREIAQCLEHSKSKIRRIYERAMQKMKTHRTNIEDFRSQTKPPTTLDNL